MILVIASKRGQSRHLYTGFDQLREAVDEGARWVVARRYDRVVIHHAEMAPIGIPFEQHPEICKITLRRSTRKTA